MEQLKRDLAKHELKHCYLLYGEEAYLIRNFKNRLKEAVVGDDTLNFAYFEGKDVKFTEAREAITAMPFFGDNRMILFENSGLFKNAAKDDWESLLTAIPESSYVVFIESAVDKRNRMYKLIGKIGYAAELKHPRPRDLEKWAGQAFVRSDMRIGPDALSLFVQMTGDSMERMETEIKKICDYCLDRGEITIPDIEAVTTPHVENRVFDMIECVSEGREQDALNLYYDLVTLHEEAMRIHPLIARHFNQLLQVRSMIEEGATRENIASRMKLAPFIAGKLMKQARAFTANQLKEYLTLCVSSDEAIKTGNLNATLSVEMLIITISRRKTA